MHKLCKRISIGKDSGKLNFRGGKFERLGRPDETLYDLCLRGAGRQFPNDIVPPCVCKAAAPTAPGTAPQDIVTARPLPPLRHLHAVNYDRCRSGEDVPPIALFSCSFVISY
ncbi:hypothetical protein J6590_059511 [Homalodisca vitripennis]|nr:hypothetical protein J6590_059511 [Homalodisca vitripennis]